MRTKMAEVEERRNLLGSDDEGDNVSFSDTTDGPGPRRTMSAITDPSRLPHRIIVLSFMCFLGFGSYFCYDNPAALQKQVVQDMNLNTVQFMQLYSWYSWPNVILCFLGGFMLDRVFGIRLGTIIFALFVFVGQVIFASGALLNRFWLMEAGRFVFGIGGESLAVAQNTYAVNWFKGKELNLVFGLQLSMARLGSTVNMNIMGWVYNRVGDLVGSAGYTTLGVSLMIGALTCVFSLVCALVLAVLDRRAERILNKEQSNTGEVIKLTDVKDFPFPLWLIFLICVGYYVAIFPFIGLGQQERAVGSLCSCVHSARSHDAGLHLLEPLDRHVSPRLVILPPGLCSVAHGGLRGARTPAGDRIRLHAVHPEPGAGPHLHGSRFHPGQQRIPLPGGLLQRLRLLGSDCRGDAVLCGLSPRWRSEPVSFSQSQTPQRHYS
ncbi:major facilitator superfamily domain-containing protein 1 isoform X2 [Hypomesus transpacificus]|uniref:major facilitator superfamily domain-containing protein 1 isoform X2 n=1 Tax=Hypomesus transpacificus TaxID=137520 RepID=UPI001F081563|nr:major facilitator superfamily domain-containing protein 1 isoform X2 [Hypomesus transpacificus]